MTRVLIVEDVDEMRELLSQAIGAISGMKVSGTVSNSVEARIELSRRRPDLVLLDEILPGESGMDFLKELYSQKLPVILITSMENPTHPLPPEALARIIKPTWDTLDQDSKRLEKEISEALRHKK